MIASTQPAMARPPACRDDATFGLRQAADLWFEVGDRSRSIRRLDYALDAYLNAARKSDEALDLRRRIAAYVEIAAVLSELGRFDELPAVADRLFEVAKEPRLPDGVLAQSVIFATLIRRLPEHRKEFLLLAHDVRRHRRGARLEAVDDLLTPLLDDSRERP